MEHRRTKTIELRTLAYRKLQRIIIKFKNKHISNKKETWILKKMNNKHKQVNKNAKKAPIKIGAFIFYERLDYSPPSIFFLSSASTPRSPSVDFSTLF